MKTIKFHKDFKLNNNSFQNNDDLLSYAKNLSTEIYSFLKNWFSSDSFLNVQTSGSTEKPKQIKLQKEFMINSAIATSKYFNLPAKTTALLCLSTNYIAGKMMMVRALNLGWHLDVINTNSNPLEEVSTRYDFSAMVPLQVENSLEKLQNIRKLIIGGGIVSNSLQNKLQSINTKVFATYGMTETITHIAVKKLNHNNLLPNFYFYKIYLTQFFCILLSI